MKRVLTAAILIFLFALPVSAEQSVYYEQYSASGVEEALDTLNGDTKDFLNSNGLTPENSEFVNNISAESVLSHIFNFFKSGIKNIIRDGASMLAVVLITCGISAFSENKNDFKPAVFTGVLTVALISARSLWSVINASVSALKGCSAFMLSFTPAFAGIVTVSGMAATAVKSSALLIAAAQGLSMLCSYFILPLIGGYLAVSICSGVSPFLNGIEIAGAIKKAAMFAEGLILAVFTGVMSIQTAVNSAADTVSLRTAKFLLGSGVPVAGTALSEAASTVISGIKLLKSTVGIWGVVAVAVIMLPILCELISWRLVLNFVSAVSQMLGGNSISSLLKSADTVLSLLVGLILTVSATFIISLTVVVKAGGGG